MENIYSLLNTTVLRCILSMIALVSTLPLQSQTPVTDYWTTNLPTSNPLNYSVDGTTYFWGTGSNLFLDSVELSNTAVYEFFSSPDSVVIRRVDNASSSGSRCRMFAQRSNDAGTILVPDYPGNIAGTCSLEEVLLNPVLNRGVEDMFLNTGPKANTIERIDFITDLFTPISAGLLDDAGVLAIEKNGNNQTAIAAITSLDVNGNPDGYATLTIVQIGNSFYGEPKTALDFASFQPDQFSPTFDDIEFNGYTTEQIGISFVSLANLGLNPGQQFYGFSIFGPDITQSTNLIDYQAFPTTTSSGDGADYHGGLGLIYVNYDSLPNGLAFPVVTAVDEFLTTSLDVSLTFNVQTNDLGDFDISTLSIIPSATPTNGSATINNVTGSSTYTPNTGYLGLDFYDYVICDSGSVHCDTATVFLTVAQNIDTDGDGVLDMVDLDDDNDGIYDSQEICGTNPVPMGNATALLTVVLDLDEYENETSYLLTNSTGTISSGGPFAGGNDLITFSQTVSVGGDYTLTIFDSFGDGLNLNGGSDENGTSGYSISIDNVVIDLDLSSPDFGFQLDVDFIVPIGNNPFSCLPFDPGADDDGDGVINYLDADYCTLNAAGVCATMDADADGIPNHLDTDSDNDLCSDANESYGTSSADGNDGNEFYGMGNPPAINGDGTVVGALYNSTSNGTYNGSISPVCPVDTDGDGILDNDDLDDDNDGIPDLAEITGVLPNPDDCDGASLNFENSFQEPGFGDNDGIAEVGEVFRFPNVTTGVDALITILSASNGVIDILDDPADGFPQAFQPRMTFSGVGTPSIDFRIGFVDAGTSTPKIIDLFGGVVNDVDGGGSIRESYKVSSPDLYILDNPTGLVVDDLGGGVLQFSASGNDGDQPGIGTSPFYQGYWQNNIPIASVDFTFQLIKTSTGSFTRQYSLLVDQCAQIGFNSPDISIDLSNAPDFDMDGIPNHLDLDSDNDGIYDATEANHGANLANGLVNGPVGIDGVPNAVQNAGQDGTGNINFMELDTDSDDNPDRLDIDSDNDLCVDANEAYQVNNADSDGNGYYGAGDPPAIDTFGRVIAAAYGPNDDAARDSLNFVACSSIDALDDVETTIEDVAVDVNILDNDVVSGSTLNLASVVVLSEPPNGGTTVDLSNGIVTYTPNTNFNGVDSFEYVVCAGLLTPPICDTATAVITIVPINDAPIAMDDADTASEDIPVTIDVVANDNDDLDPLGNIDPTTVMEVNAPLNGSIMINGITGEITYTPDPEVNGVDSFTYVVCDDGNPVPALCDTATVVINVTPVNDAPIAINDDNNTFTDVPVDGEVLGNDFDPEGDDLTITTTPVTDPLNGTVVINPDGTYTYTPDPMFEGEDVFTYEVCDDGSPVECDTAQVTIIVSPEPIDGENNPPIANDDENITFVGTPVSSTVINNDDDPDGDNLTVTTTPTDAPDNGTVLLSSNGDYTYTPNPGFTGQDVFTYEVCDDGTPVECVEANVYIDVYNDPSRENDPPFAGDDFYTMKEDSSKTGDLLANDTDPNGDNLVVTTTPLVDPMNGMVVINPDGTFTYTPDLDFNGPDKFVYEVCDDGTPIECSRATVYLLIDPVEDYGTVTINVLMEGNIIAPGAMTTLLNEYHLLPGQDPAQSTNVGSQFLGTAEAPCQPYRNSPYNHLGMEGCEYGDTGVATISYPVTVTDWVLVSLRKDDITPASEIWKCAGLLHTDGTVEFPESCPFLTLIDGDDYHIVVEHRNHLAVMSTVVQSLDLEVQFDFSENQSWLFGTGSPNEAAQKQIGSDFVMLGGNGTQGSGRTDINSADNATWINDFGDIFNYQYGDHTMDGDVNSVDRALWIQNNGFFNLIQF